jgi:peptide/nickel transport system permease protein
MSNIAEPVSIVPAAASVAVPGRRIRRERDPGLILGAALVLAFLVVAVVAPAVAPLDPTYQYANGLTPDGAPLPPGSGTFILGTDQIGRDMLTRLLYGAREAMLIATLPNLLALILATVIGVAAGYFGGRIEMILMRGTEMMMTLPTFLLAMALLAVLGAGTAVVVLALVLVTWTYPARVIYGEVLRIKEYVYVEAERALGASAPRILWHHILPQLRGVLIVYLALNASFMVMTEAGLSYLGFGVPPPTPSWGSMIGDSQDYYLTAPWLALLPGACIALLTIGFSLLGSGIQRRSGPRRARVQL